jgi:hypothetical protein
MFSALPPKADIRSDAAVLSHHIYDLPLRISVWLDVPLCCAERLIDNVRFSRDSGRIAEIARCRLCADCVAKVRKRRVTNFPPKDQTSQDR